MMCLAGIAPAVLLFSYRRDSPPSPRIHRSLQHDCTTVADRCLLLNRQQYTCTERWLVPAEPADFRSLYTLLYSLYAGSKES